MKRFVAILLTLSMLSALPATVLAADNGVIGNNVPNQSIDNALNQYIPETVIVDGNVDKDTAWVNHQWNEVDSGNGTWDKEKGVAESSKNLAYKYQLHYDYEYLYGAFVLNTLNAEVTVWLKDGSNAAGGYSHKMVYTVSDGNIAAESFVDYNGNSITADASLDAQKYLKAITKTASSVTFEFRRYLDSFTEAEGGIIEYFVSVKVGEDSLYFPRIKTTSQVQSVEPNGSYWPVTTADNHLDHQEHGEKLSPITVDGKFDEAAWAGLTDFYKTENNMSDFKEDSTKNYNDFSNVKYSNIFKNVSNTDTITVNDPTNANDTIRLKYEYRVDGEYFYLAVVAYIPAINKHKVLGKPTAAHPDELFEITAQPDLYVYFFNQSNQYRSKNGGDSEVITGPSTYNGWAIESLIQINTAVSKTGAFCDVKSRLNAGGTEIDGFDWADTDGDDYAHDTESYYYKGAYSKQNDGLWYFEMKCDIKNVAGVDANGNLKDFYFNVLVADRTWVDRNGANYIYYDASGNKVAEHTSFNRNTGYCGGVVTTGSFPHYHYSNGHKVDASEECVGNTIEKLPVDSILDKQYNTMISGLDNKISGTVRGTGFGDVQMGYVINADYEYLYGAAIINKANAWVDGKDGDVFRLWLNSDNIPGHRTAYQHCITFAHDTEKGGIVRSWYSNYGSSKNVTSEKSDYKIVMNLSADKKTVYLEFRVALSEIEFTPDLTPGTDQLMIAYYVSLETNGGGSNGIVHPRTPGGENPGTWKIGTEGRIFYQPPTGAVRNNQDDVVMLDYISIDGKLDEEIWDTESDRITVNGNNGKWSTIPTKNEVFDYSYVIYSGDNFIYGAAEINVEAVPRTSESGSDYTRFELWLDNPGSFDEWGVYSEDALYDNYFYNIYLYDHEYSDMGPSGPVYGGSTPLVDHNCYKWALTVANGKTYVEFMISTDSYQVYADGTTHTRFSVNEDAGFNYFVKVIHPTEDNERLNLVHPSYENMFYLTHYNNFTVEGAGVIFTDPAKYNQHSTAANNAKWWNHVAFKPSDKGDGCGWEIVDISLGVRNGKGVTLDIPEGGFVYAENSGNNYIHVIKNHFEQYELYLEQHPDATYDQYVATTGISKSTWLNYERHHYANLNYYSHEATTMSDHIEKWSVGDVIVIPGLNATAVANQSLLGNEDENQVVCDIYEFQKNGSTVTSRVDGTTKIDLYDAVKVTRKPKYYESGFKINSHYYIYQESEGWAINLPATDAWYSENSGKLVAMKHVAPELITVDGDHNDSGWDDNGWLVIDADINATTQSTTGEKFDMKYQLRTDGKYIYLAAVMEGVDFSATNPAFRFWINDGTDNWTKYFEISKAANGCTVSGAQVPTGSGYHSVSDSATYTNFDIATGNVVYTDNWLFVALNKNPAKADLYTPNEKLKYEDSHFYGYTETVEESIGGRYYPDIELEIRDYLFAQESAVMKSDGDGNTLIEFKVAVDEVDADRDGFEYSISAANYAGVDVVYSLFYPAAYCEPHSEYNYYNYNLPVWNWYSDTAIKFTKNDYYGDLYMLNNYAPVVTLGAKFNEAYSSTDEKTGETTVSQAIRFGGLYNEKLIRYQTGAEDANYWDVTDMGMVLIATDKLGASQELKLGTEGAQKVSANAIVKHQSGTNFADYESFAFYVTVKGIPNNEAANNAMISARTFISYRDYTETTVDGVNKIHGTDAPDYYGDIVSRSINLIKANLNNGNEQDKLPA